MKPHHIILALLCLPAGTPAWSQDAAPAGAAAPNFKVVDNRAKDDKKQKVLSHLITSCDYNILRLGDDKTPDRMTRLRDDLAAIKGAALDGKTLNVSSYHIYLNYAAVTRDSVNSSFGSLVTKPLEKKGTKCPKEKMKGGWFEASELTAPTSPLIVEIQATYEGQPLVVRAVHSPPLQLSGTFKKPAEIEQVVAVMHKAAEALARQLP